MSDLTSGRYPNQAAGWAYFGMQNNLTQPSMPAFTNWPGPMAVEGPVVGASIITKEETTFPVWLPWGTPVSQISLSLGSTEIETLSHAFFVVRSAPALAIGGEFKPVLQAESGDLTTLTGAKTETITMKLKSPLLVTPEIAPFGYVYFSVFMEATKVGTYVSYKTPASASMKAVSGLKVFPWYANAPLFTKSKPASATVPEKEPKECPIVEIVPLVLVQ